MTSGEQEDFPVLLFLRHIQLRQWPWCLSWRFENTFWSIFNLLLKSWHPQSLIIINVGLVSILLIFTVKKNAENLVSNGLYTVL